MPEREWLERWRECRVPVRAAAVDLGLWAMLALILLLIVPRQRQIFADFGVQLPRVTLLVLDTSEWLAGRMPGQSIPGVIWAGLMVVMITAGVGWAFRWRGMRPFAWLLLILWTLVPIAAILLIIFAMFAPMVEMIDSLQGGKM